MGQGQSKVNGFGELHTEVNAEGGKKSSEATKNHQHEASNLIQQQVDFLKSVAKQTGDAFVEARKKSPERGALVDMDPVQHSLEIEKTLSQFKETSGQLKKAGERLSALLAVDTDSNLESMVKANALMFIDATDLIEQATYLADVKNQKIAETQKNIKQLEARAKAELGQLYLHSYWFARKNNESPDTVLLDAFDQLGDAVPTELKAPLSEAKAHALASGTLSEFDKAYLRNDYSGALKSLTEKNRTLNSHGPSFHGLSASDIAKAWEESQTSRAQQSKDIVYRLNSKSPAYQKLAEGYAPVAFESDTAENAYGFTTMVKKMPNGTLSVLNFSQDGYPLYGEAESARSYEVTPEDTQNNERDEGRLTANFNRLVKKMPSFKKIGEASLIIQNEFATVQTLFNAGKEGKMTNSYVYELKTIAQKLENSNELAILRANLKDVKRDIDLLKQIPIGERGPFESQIAQLEAAYTKLVSVVDGPKIQDFCDAILNPSFTAPTAKSWIIKEGLVTLAGIVGGVALGAITFGTGGLGGVVITAALGTTGYMVGREAGHAYSEMVGTTEYGNGYSNKSLLGYALSGEKKFSDGEFKGVLGKDVALEYGVEFASRIAAAMAGYGLAKVTGPLLTGLKDAYKTDPGVRGSLARIVEILTAEEVKPAQNSATRMFLENMGDRFVKRIKKKATKAVLKQLEGMCEEFQSFAKESLQNKVLTEVQFAYSGLEFDNNSLVRSYAVKAGTDSEFASISNTLKVRLEKEGYQVKFDANGTIAAEKMSNYSDNEQRYKIIISRDHSPA